MYAVKKETAELLCHGCLSSDRRLAPLTEYEMFFTLLGNKHSIEEHKYLNVLLCWECHALLHRTQAFRQRLLRAQYTLSTLSVGQPQTSTDCLSSLKCKHKQDYDCTIEETIELKPIELSILNTELNIKEELDTDIYTDNFESNYTEIDVPPMKKRKCYKKERDTKQLQKIDSELKLDNNVKTYKEIDEHGSVKKRKYKRDREAKQLQKIDSGVDLSDPDKYFSEVCLSEREVEEVLAREREEDISRRHKCGTCGFWFTNKSELYRHKRLSHRRRSTVGKCHHCPFPYKSVWELELHMLQSHPVGMCSLCGHIVGNPRERRGHLLQHRSRYRCLKCAAEFDNKQLYLHHEKLLHSKYICDHCGHISATRQAVEKHIVRHHLPHKCSCGLLFPSWDKYRRHVRNAHARTGPAYCVECDVTFPTRAKYTRHLSQSQKHRPKKKISIPCPECGKVFSRRNYMNNHIKLFHSNQSRHHCQLCDKYFVNGFSLRSHNKYVHQKIPMPKTKICSVCGRGFATNRVLENHMRTHTGERPFACAHCAAAFAQRVALKAHLAAIHKEK